MRTANSAYLIECIYMCVPDLRQGNSFHLCQQSKLCFHKHLPIQMDLSTAEMSTGLSPILCDYISKDAGSTILASNSRRRLKGVACNTRVLHHIWPRRSER